MPLALRGKNRVDASRIAGYVVHQLLMHTQIGAEIV